MLGSLVPRLDVAVSATIEFVTKLTLNGAVQSEKY